MDLKLPTIREIEAARRNVYRYLTPTPLLAYPGVDELVGTRVWIKHENHHGTGAFKVRGGVNLAASLSEAERKRGLCTASTGSHGQSIAFAGQVTGTPVTVAVPEGAHPGRVAAIEALGARVLVRGRDFDEAREWMAAEAQRTGARMIGPTEPELIAGVASYTLEILERLPEVDTFVVPVGSGSGAAAICLTARGKQVIGVQAAAAPTAYLTWRNGAPTFAPMRTEAEGLATRVPFANTQSVLTDPEVGLADFWLVSDAAMRRAALDLLERTHNLAELAGAAPLAGAVQHRDELAGRIVVLILTGGNLSVAKLRDILDECSVGRA